ncbi:hypothetical protein D3C76_1166460 [compost metagenome]
MQGEEAATGDEEAHLVLAMAVLVEELGAQFGLLRVVGGQADHVHRDIALFLHQPVDLRPVGGDHFLLAGARGDGGGSLPALEAHTDGRKGGGDVIQVGQHLVRQVGAGFVVDGQAAHQGTPCGPPPTLGRVGRLRYQSGIFVRRKHQRLVIERVFSSHSKRNSKASTWRRASLMRGPQV